MSNEGLTCGQEVASDAEVPERLARLMNHVAGNMETHAAWVGKATEAARGEHDALVAVAVEYRSLAAAAGRAAGAMTAMKDLPAAPHDPTGLDRRGQAQWMRAKIEMQRAFARLLLEHAELSEAALAQLEARGGGSV